MGGGSHVELILALPWGSMYLPGAQDLITLNLACIKTGFTIDDILDPPLSQSVVTVHSVTCNRSQEMEASAPKGGLFNLSSASSSPHTPLLALADYEEEGRTMFSSELT